MGQVVKQGVVLTGAYRGSFSKRITTSSGNSFEKQVATFDVGGLAMCYVSGANEEGDTLMLAALRGLEGKMVSVELTSGKYGLVYTGGEVRVLDQAA